LVLLAAFVAGIAKALRAGATPDCHCFGAIHSAPVGRSQIARNIGLGALAGLILGGGPGPALDSWVAARSAAELVAVGTTAAAIVLAVFALETWRENRRLRDQLAVAGTPGVPPGLRVGMVAPDFTVPDEDGATIALDSLRARGLPVALVFVAAGCGPCEALLPELERLQTTVADRLTLAFVGRGSIAHYEQLQTAQGGDLMLGDARTDNPDLQHELDDLVEVFSSYRLRGTPSAVVVSPEGTIASATVDGRPAIEALIRLALAGPIPRAHGAAAVAQTVD
jgi:thiol-disulfide isomerase/thioredoxin